MTFGEYLEGAAAVIFGGMSWYFASMIIAMVVVIAAIVGIAWIWIERSMPLWLAIIATPLLLAATVFLLMFLNWSAVYG